MKRLLDTISKITPIGKLFRKEFYDSVLYVFFLLIIWYSILKKYLKLMVTPDFKTLSSFLPGIFFLILDSLSYSRRDNPRNFKRWEKKMACKLQALCFFRQSCKRYWRTWYQRSVGSLRLLWFYTKEAFETMKSFIVQVILMSQDS